MNSNPIFCFPTNKSTFDSRQSSNFSQFPTRALKPTWWVAQNAPTQPSTHTVTHGYRHMCVHIQIFSHIPSHPFVYTSHTHSTTNTLLQTWLYRSTVTLIHIQCHIYPCKLTAMFSLKNQNHITYACTLIPCLYMNKRIVFPDVFYPSALYFPPNSTPTQEGDITMSNYQVMGAWSPQVRH